MISHRPLAIYKYVHACARHKGTQKNGVQQKNVLVERKKVGSAAKVGGLSKKFSQSVEEKGHLRSFFSVCRIFRD